WDARNSASPVVLPPKDGGEWRMWYYGRAGTTWARGVDAFLPTGRIGAATSVDGARWRRLKGPLEGGACLDPSEDEDAFDCVHVGVGDVVELPNGTLWMYYFGGGLDGVPRPGIRMQIGLATSEDGLTWRRHGAPVLAPGDPGDFDETFVAWPRVLPPWDTKNVPGIVEGQWYMSYHTASFKEGIQWSAGAAFSNDGISWTKVPKPVLEGGGGGAWDEKGVGVRHPVLRPDGRLVMVYEAVDSAMDHAMGLAESSDGITWTKVQFPEAERGGPILKKGAADAWDSRVVGTPYVVPPVGPEDPWRLYYVGEATEKPGLSVGLAESFDERLQVWRKRRADADSLPKSNNEGLYSRVWKKGERSQTRDVSSAAGDLDL
ncbi:unnamed protein product, partial [Symbiodinium natans]